MIESAVPQLQFAVEPVLVHSFRHGTSDAVSHVYARQAKMRKRADIELNSAHPD